MDIHEFIRRYLEKGKEGMLATIVAKTARGAGAKMFVGEDGKAFGTIGGGRLESAVCRRAIKMMGNGRASLYSVNPNGIGREKIAACGGDIQILLEPVTTKHVDLYRKIENLEKECRKGVVVTKFGKNIFTKSVLAEDMSITGDRINHKIVDWCRCLLDQKKPVLVGGVLAEPLRQGHGPAVELLLKN